MSLGSQIIYKQLLARHKSIRIPMIQRDYAQGRPEEKEVREEFLDALEGALRKPIDDPSLPLNLDFIYGSVEGKDETRFLPLDGQQRLTTLFLLHWYLAWNDQEWNDFSQMFRVNHSTRFSYSVRPSSNEFFDELAAYQPAHRPEKVMPLSRLISDQPWYFRSWRLDPTIQSALTMLDAIHNRFSSSKGLYARLVNESKPAITFQLLDLDNFGLSDDLYIKMNARGKPLTPFETFKALYEQELENQFDGEIRLIGDQSFPVAEFFARRMDTRWADFFWSHRDKDTNLYDGAVMNLFRTVAIVSRVPESDSYINDITSLRTRWQKFSYSVFHTNGWLDRRFSEILFMLLEAWSKEGTYFATQLPNESYFDEIAHFNQAVSDPATLGYTQLVQFVSYVVFMREHGETGDPSAFQEWMRIVFNLTVNTSYDRPADMQRSIAGILKLAPSSGNILEYFAATEKPTIGFSEQQIAEEKLKAELIKADGGWRPLIDRAESHGYFRGQIDFLLDFCGVKEKRSVIDGKNWGVDMHVEQQKRFENYLRKAEMMFRTQGLTNLGEYRWERALLSIGDYLLPSGGRNSSFLVNSSTDQASWKRLLRGFGPKVPEARKLLQQLLDLLNQEKTVEEQLDEIVAGERELQPWRKVLIETPKAIEYCEQRAIRLELWNNKIYLLRKSQMNGVHAELFTFCLYHDLLHGLECEGRLAPLELKDYQFVSGTAYEPHILLEYQCKEHLLAFKVEFSGTHFLTYIGEDSINALSNIKALLVDSLGFQEIEGDLLKKSGQQDIQNDLLELSRVLAEMPT